MRYNDKEFTSAVNYYKNSLIDQNIKDIFIYGKINRDAFLSIAPLSKAAHDLDFDLFILFEQGVENYKVMFDIWKTYDEIDLINNKKTNLLKTFIKTVKYNITDFEDIFQAPSLILKAEDRFNGNIRLDYNIKWFKPYIKDKLKKCTDKIIKKIIDLKKEHFSIVFPLICDSDIPLQDFLDSYSFCYSLFLSAYSKSKMISLKANTLRESGLDSPERINELLTTFTGLELEKDIEDIVFRDYKSFSGELRLDRLKIEQASLIIKTKGEIGRHFFGELIGYPTKNMKTRRDSINGLMYKLPSEFQSYEEERTPLTRSIYTDIVPIEKLINAVLVDYKKIENKNKAIGSIFSMSEKIIVKGNNEDCCDFEIGLVKENGQRRIIYFNEIETKEPKKQYGTYRSIPLGEVGITPTYLRGKIIGDIGIWINKSYVLENEEKIIIESSGDSYIITSGPRRIIEIFKEKKEKEWKKIIEQEKNFNFPKELVDIKKKNFNRIGKFSIGTNPEKELCSSMVINKKELGIISINLGCGFEADSYTTYQMELVINAKYQNLDIYGIDKKEKKMWIFKKGILVAKNTIE